MTAVTKNVQIIKINETVEKYNNTYNWTMKTKPADVKLGTYTDYGVQHNDKDPKLKVSDWKFAIIHRGWIKTSYRTVSPIFISS